MEDAKKSEDQDPKYWKQYAVNKMKEVSVERQYNFAQ